MKRVLCLFMLIGCLGRGYAVQIAAVSGGYPFGMTDDKDIARLMAYAKTEGVDLAVSMDLAYKNDDSALSRAFVFSLKFAKLDDNARTFGQIIWSSFLNLAESRGPDWFGRLVAAQPETVRQRIRDIIYYPINQVPSTQRGEADVEVRNEYPSLFPKDYSYGLRDLVYGNQANQHLSTTDQGKSGDGETSSQR